MSLPMQCELGLKTCISFALSPWRPCCEVVHHTTNIIGFLLLTLRSTSQGTQHSQDDSDGHVASKTKLEVFALELNWIISTTVTTVQ